MDPLRLIAAARSIESLAPAVAGLEPDAAERADLRAAVERGYFTPDEDQRFRVWFSRYLTARAGLLETIDELVPVALEGEGDVDDRTRMRCFVVAYTAACLLVRAGRFLVGDLAREKVVQRKLNEPDERHRIPRKQYTRIYRSLTSPVTAWRLYEATQLADTRRCDIESFRDDPLLAGVLPWLDEAEESLRVRLDHVLRARLRYRWHSYRRRRASAAKVSVFKVMEMFGRIIADVRNPLHMNRVTAAMLTRVTDLLEPGDVIVTRHDDAFSNLFLPGYWPHAALHIGLESTRDRLGDAVSADRAARWTAPNRVLEARKDGVRFRPIDDTLAVDALAVIRPELPVAEIDEALARAISHEGKLYNFDFDFFTADRLVCTEVVYRAYEGAGPISFDLVERAGRLTLSAEDLLDRAVDGNGFEAIAVFGAPSCPDRLVTGSEARPALERSYRGAGKGEDAEARRH